MQSYWSRFTRQRVSRRRAIAGGTALAASAAFLAACGGDDDDAGTVPTGGGTGATGATSTTGATGVTGTTGATGAPDADEQKSLVQDAIRYITGQMYNVPRPTLAKLLTNWWPAIGNVGLNNTYAGGNIWVEERINWWVDTSQPGNR